MSNERGNMKTIAETTTTGETITLEVIEEKQNGIVIRYPNGRKALRTPDGKEFTIPETQEEIKARERKELIADIREELKAEIVSEVLAELKKA